MATYLKYSLANDYLYRRQQFQQPSILTPLPLEVGASIASAPNPTSGDVGLREEERLQSHRSRGHVSTGLMNLCNRIPKIIPDKTALGDAV